MTVAARDRLLVPDDVRGLALTVEPSVLVGSRSLPDGFFVALPAFAYTLVGGLPLGPFFGPLPERAASKEKELVR